MKMKNIKYSSKKWLNLLITSACIIGNNILKVKADDCKYIENAINFFGNDIKAKYDKDKPSDCCKFEGVICKVINNENHVVEINFNEYRTFDGKESEAIKELSNLEHLETLTLRSFLFDGRFPVGFGKLKSLKTLNLIHNTFMTPIPDELGELVNLNKLDLSYNYLRGSVPSSLGNLKKLKILNLKHNRLKGVLPYEFRNMTNLEQLLLDHNISLSGYVPLIDKLGICSYSATNLCNLKEAKCKDADYDCSKEDIKKTDELNGNPDPIKNSYLTMKPKPTHKIITGILIILIITILILLCRKKDTINNKKDKKTIFSP